MSDTTSLVISIVSLSGTILATAIGAYATYYNEERKARREVSKILLKYRDPLLLAAQDLQARLYGLCDTDLLKFMVRDDPGEEIYKDTLYIYTAYVVGQYLSWAWILRRQAQFMALMSSTPPKSWNIFASKKTHDTATTLMQKIDKIRFIFAEDTYGDLEKPFILFKAHQTGIGEIMSCQDAKTGEYYCMGFATFTQRWKRGDPKRCQTTQPSEHTVEKSDEQMAGVSIIPDRDFRAAFKTVEDGINNMWSAREALKVQNEGRVGKSGSDGRLRRLQHLLLDLIEELDPQGLLNNKHENDRVHGVRGCLCTLASSCSERSYSRAGGRRSSESSDRRSRRRDSSPVRPALNDHAIEVYSGAERA